jgi:hypothetical protein
MTQLLIVKEGSRLIMKRGTGRLSASGQSFDNRTANLMTGGRTRVVVNAAQV